MQRDMITKKKIKMPLISLHGGHSSDFCLHADDPLEKIIETYTAKGFGIVGITEHMPPPNNELRYPDEIEAGIDAEEMRERFERYFETARRLQREFASRIKMFIGFETEWYDEEVAFVEELIEQHKPDYIVGSLHHIGDIPFDYDEDRYMQATAFAGGLDELYEIYFDRQRDLITSLSPAVIGHFDLIRIHDPNYGERISKPSIQQRIIRNLKLIKEKGILMDMNTRAYSKGADEPYPCRSIIETARDLGITMVPGDDSHGVPSIGYRIEQAVHMLDNLGFDTNWDSITARITH